MTLPAELAKLVPRNHLMTETEWRNLGHFLIYLVDGKEGKDRGIQRPRMDISSDRHVLLGLLQILRFAVDQAFRFFIQVFSKVLAGSTTCFTLPSPRFSIVPKYPLQGVHCISSSIMNCLYTHYLMDSDTL